MKMLSGAALAVAMLVAVSGCGGSGGTPQADSSSTGSATPTTSTSPSPSGQPSLSGNADLDCLVAGSPWKVSIPDLESQFPALMRGINVTGVHIVGAQTLTVTPALHATFTDNTTTTIRVAMGNGLNMVMVQRHSGTASGAVTADGNTLTAQHWDGGIHGTTTVTINGRASQAPFQAPTATLGEHPMTYTCADGSLNLSVQGSPFQYLFQSH